MAARSDTNFGSKGALAVYGSSAAFRFEVPKRACGRWCRNFKSAALERSPRRDTALAGSPTAFHNRRHETGGFGMDVLGAHIFVLIIVVLAVLGLFASVNTRSLGSQ